MKKVHPRIDDEGTYSQYRGVTIISSVSEGDLPYWQEVHAYLNQSELIKKYYAPLPYESYHMTTNNLVAEADFNNGDWEGLIDKNLGSFKSMHKYLTEHQFNPKPTINSSIVAGVIHLVVTIPQEQQLIINEFAKIFSIQNRIPGQFHITLAYNYKPITEEIQNFIELELNNKIQHILNSKNLTLNPPTLCYFNDMTAFIPWNGSAWPFEDSSSKCNFSK